MATSPPICLPPSALKGHWLASGDLFVPPASILSSSTHSLPPPLSILPKITAHTGTPNQEEPILLPPHFLLSTYQHLPFNIFTRPAMYRQILAPHIRSKGNPSSPQSSEQPQNDSLNPAQAVLQKNCRQTLSYKIMQEPGK